MRHLLAAAMVLLTALPLWGGARHTVLMDVLQISALSRILQDEGTKFGASLNENWLNGQGGPAWQQQVERIYDRDRITERIRAGLETTLQGDALELTITFFASSLGQRIITLENSARVAMDDDDIDAEARERWSALQDRDPHRFAMLTRMIDAGDLVNRNVTSALNSNFQFLRALVDGGAFVMSEDEILGDVLAERDDITTDTDAWIGAFMLLAYSPLSDAELETYVSFAETPTGAALNAGFFAGFDPLYRDISYALGRALALNMAAEEL